MSSREERSCRMCHSSAGKCVSPCCCDGSIKYVHSKCLARWVRHRKSLICEVCGTPCRVAKLSSYSISATNYRWVTLIWIFSRVWIRENARILSISLLVPIFSWLTFVLEGSLKGAGSIYSPVKVTLTHTHTLSEWGPTEALSYTVWVLTKLTAASMLLKLVREHWPGIEPFVREAPNADEQGRPVLEGRAVNQLQNWRTDAVEEGKEGEYDASGEGGDVEGEPMVSATSGLIVEVAVHPRDDGVVLQAIEAAHSDAGKSKTLRGKLKEELLHLVLPFFFLNVFCTVLCVLAPEVVRIKMWELWVAVDGNSRAWEVADTLLATLSPSENVARMRGAMVKPLIEALGSSDLLHAPLYFARLTFVIWIVVFVMKGVRCVPLRTFVLEALSLLRCIMAALVLPTFFIRTTTLLVLFLSMDFFDDDRNVGIAEDKKRAWQVITTPVSVRHEDERPTTLLVLKSLKTVLGSERREVCFDFGAARVLRSGINATVDQGVTLDGEEAEDPVLFFLFALSVIVSVVDMPSMWPASDVILAVVISQFFFIVGFATRLPGRWFRWTMLHKVASVTGLRQLCALLDLWALLRVCAEINFIVAVICGGFLPYAFGAYQFFSRNDKPLVLLVTRNLLSSFRWAKGVFMLVDVSLNIAWYVDSRLGDKMGELFDVRGLALGDGISITGFLSKALRCTAFVACSSICSCIWIGICLALFDCLVVRSSCFVDTFFYGCRCIITVYMINDNEAWSRMLSIVELPFKGVRQFTEWKCRWLFSSSFGIWAGPQYVDGVNVAQRELTLITGMPTWYTHLCCSRIMVALDELQRNATADDAEVIQRVAIEITPLIRREEQACTLTEEQMMILFRCLKFPGMGRLLTLLLVAALLLLALPFMVGACVVSSVLALFLSPSCVVASGFVCGFLWVVGVVATGTLIILTDKLKSDLGPVRLYFSCGCHHMPLFEALAFAVMPIFMTTTTFIVFPFALAVMAWPHVRQVDSFGAFFMRFDIATLCLIFRLLLRCWTRLSPAVFAFFGRVQQVRVRNDGENSRVVSAPQEVAAPAAAKPGASAVLMVREATANMWKGCVDVGFECCAKLCYVRNHILRRLVETAESESIVGVAFIDRPT
ncbi:hypothetical protein, conserved [Trypanosoma brucei brucei TREU927]|uniref:RING-type E3 ubiquitin transferase n=1 Tax=Trypanosoma brucei brucei (strain 927/4 GUTat10.1) TaxID=185431 RepID=Q381G2_TRYB2|nr:hypothetical protein, conserved [Trypanosoma brucei brucei TREU927]EAN80569.1 hypothetical protein, conserved [Trypanosoma brucei brucei TREU927]